MSAPQGWADFRAKREETLREPYGWLTIRSFHWLPEEPGELPGLPGRWWVDGDDAVVETSGDELTGERRATVAETGRVPWLERTVDGVPTQIELLRRGGRLAIRERAETSPGREAFAGIATYPYDPAYRVQARFTPFAEGSTVDVATHRPELRQTLRAVGEVRFELDGQPQRLTVTSIKYGLGIEFHDPTNGTETPAWRQVKIDDPDDGLVTIDLNETILMWFAVTGHATCPAPVEGNTISVPVRAGERL